MSALFCSDFLSNAIADHEQVEFTPHEAAESVFRRAMIGSPRTLKEVLTSTGHPVKHLNSVSSRWNLGSRLTVWMRVE